MKNFISKILNVLRSIRPVNVVSHGVYFQGDITNSVSRIEKLVSGGTWTGDFSMYTVRRANLCAITPSNPHTNLRQTSFHTNSTWRYINNKAEWHRNIKAMGHDTTNIDSWILRKLTNLSLLCRSKQPWWWLQEYKLYNPYQYFTNRTTIIIIFTTQTCICWNGICLHHSNVPPLTSLKC